MADERGVWTKGSARPHRLAMAAILRPSGAANVGTTLTDKRMCEKEGQERHVRGRVLRAEGRQKMLRFDHAEGRHAKGPGPVSKQRVGVGAALGCECLVRSADSWDHVGVLKFPALNQARTRANDTFRGRETP